MPVRADSFPVSEGDPLARIHGIIADWWLLPEDQRAPEIQRQVKQWALADRIQLLEAAAARRRWLSTLGPAKSWDEAEFRLGQCSFTGVLIAAAYAKKMKIEENLMTGWSLSVVRLGRDKIEDSVEYQSTTRPAKRAGPSPKGVLEKDEGKDEKHRGAADE